MTEGKCIDETTDRPFRSMEWTAHAPGDVPPIPSPGDIYDTVVREHADEITLYQRELVAELRKSYRGEATSFAARSGLHPAIVAELVRRFDAAGWTIEYNTGCERNESFATWKVRATDDSRNRTGDGR